MESNLHDYDLNLILDPNLTETQVQTEKDAVAAQVAKFGGEVKELDEWGNRRLAYEIRKQSEGYYLIYKLRLPGDAPKVVETALRLRDNVMRVLAVRQRPEWQTKKSAERKEEAGAAA